MQKKLQGGGQIVPTPAGIGLKHLAFAFIFFPGLSESFSYGTVGVLNTLVFSYTDSYLPYYIRYYNIMKMKKPIGLSIILL